MVSRNSLTTHTLAAGRQTSAGQGTESLRHNRQTGKSGAAPLTESDVARRYGQSAVIRVNSKGNVTLLEQSDELQDVIRGAMDKLLIGCAWDNAFPTITSRSAFVKPLLVEAAADSNAAKIKRRAQEDRSFSKALASLVSRMSHALSLHINTDCLLRSSNTSVTMETS